MDEAQIAQAIRERRVVEFDYHGEPRRVEPYLLGDVAGRLTLRGWQSGKGWRSFVVAEMERIAPTDRFFDSPREGYALDPRMGRVIASV